MTTNATTGGELVKALVQAQAIIKAIPHDARNDFHKYAYTSSEAIISECKAALTANGLSLLPTGESHTVLEGGQVLLVRQFLLMHVSGEERALSTSWPVVPDKGRPLDKATASAVTTSLAYLLRDLLLAPRVDPTDDLAAREDRPATAKPRPATIGETGAQKLLALAARKGTSLDQHGPLASLTPETARTIWRQLSALPDAPAASPATAPSLSNGTARNGHAVPF